MFNRKEEDRMKAEESIIDTLKKVIGNSEIKEEMNKLKTQRDEMMEKV